MTVRLDPIIERAAARLLAAPTYQVAVPSYARADVIGTKTLAMLDRRGVDRDRVTVFTATDDETDRYRAVIGDDWRIVTARPGLLACRMFYSNDHFPKGTPIVNVDDDMEDILALTDGDVAPWVGTFDALAALGFGALEVEACGLWGLCAVANGFYMSDAMTIGLRYIGGGVFGNYAGNSTYDTTRPVRSSAEDFETTARSYRAHGAVVRIDWLTWKTKNFATGGMQAEIGGKDERFHDHNAAMRETAADHPDIAKVVVKAGGIENIKFRVLTRAKIDRFSLERAVGIAP